MYSSDFLDNLFLCKFCDALEFQEKHNISLHQYNDLSNQYFWLSIELVNFRHVIERRKGLEIINNKNENYEKKIISFSTFETQNPFFMDFNKFFKKKHIVLMFTLPFETAKKTFGTFVSFLKFIIKEKKCFSVKVKKLKAICEKSENSRNVFSEDAIRIFDEWKTVYFFQKKFACLPNCVQCNDEKKMQKSEGNCENCGFFYETLYRYDGCHSRRVTDEASNVRLLCKMCITNHQKIN